MSENQNTEQNLSPIDWRTLDQAVRRWVALSGYEKDLEKYRSLQEDYDEKILRGYN